MMKRLTIHFYANLSAEEGASDTKPVAASGNCFSRVYIRYIIFRFFCCMNNLTGRLPLVKRPSENFQTTFEKVRCPIQTTHVM